MYAYIRGIVSDIASDRAVLEAAGVGYELFAGRKTLDKLILGEEARLYTHLHLAEGVQALYGFYTEEEREMFRRLIGISRVGPKLAVSVLSVMEPSDVISAVVTENPAAFDPVQGMGRKMAQRVILELKEQVKDTAVPLGKPGQPAAANVAENIRSEAVQALVSLGYDGLTASRAVTAVEEARNVEELITKALRKLAR
ncbi:MAG: Holliday junction branch migration protein RuvA [Clostridia bacterium]|nr:Holliday junction branch migration protein RuvA [Clostridia bacterium]